MISFPSDFESCSYKSLTCPTFGHIVISSSAYLRSPPLETIRPAKDVSVVLCVTLFFLIVNYLLLIVYSSCVTFWFPIFWEKTCCELTLKYQIFVVYGVLKHALLTRRCFYAAKDYPAMKIQNIINEGNVDLKSKSENILQWSQRFNCMYC